MKYKNRICAVLVLLSLLLLFAGCGSKTSTPKTPTETAEAFFTALKAQDAETAAKYYDGDIDQIFYFDHNKVTGVKDLSKGAEETAKELRDKLADFDYTLSDESISGDTATLNVAFSTYDFEDYIADAMSDIFDRTIKENFDGTESTALDPEDTFAALSDYLFELNEKTPSEPLPITLKKSGDTWKVQALPEDTINTLTGGAYAMLKGLDSLQ